MKKNLLKLSTIVLLITSFVSCDNDGLKQGDSNYWTTSRGQFTLTTKDGATIYFLDNKNGTATVTFDGRYPLHQMDPTSATVYVNTYTGNVIIPETADGKEVTAIGNEAFLGCHDLVTLSLPETITEFGEGTFTDCTSLTPINIPSKITEIPDACFGRCSKLTNLTIPSGVTKLGRAAFYSCSGLTSITLPDGLEEIGSIAFFFCKGLNKITIPASVKKIGNLAFGAEGTIYCNISDYYVLATTPPLLEGNLYSNLAEGVNPIIHVPTGTLAAYQAADGWKELNITEN